MVRKKKKAHKENHTTDSLQRSKRIQEKDTLSTNGARTGGYLRAGKKILHISQNM